MALTEKEWRELKALWKERAKRRLRRKLELGEKRRQIRKYRSVKESLLADVKYHCPQLQEVLVELMTGEEWPPKELEGELPKDWSQDELDGVQVNPDGRPLFVRKEIFPLFKQLMERECPLVELKQLKQEEKLWFVVDAMLNIQSYIERKVPTNLLPR